MSAQVEEDLDQVKTDKDQTKTKEELRKQNQAGQAAIRRLAQPIRSTLFIGQVLVVVSAILAIAPYIALVELGHLFLTARQQGAAVDQEAAWRIVGLLAGAYSFRLLLYFLALLLTHLADLRLRDQMRRDIVARLAKAPLAWFSESNSGLVRKAIQDDTATVHTIIAHGPIDRLNAMILPLALFGYVLYLDWRLALLAVATIPCYLASYSVGMRGMAEKTAEMDTKLAKVSASMVEFAAGITVVKAFGRVGQAHQRYLNSAEEFSVFYWAWCVPLISVMSLSFAWVSIPVLLLVNLGGGYLLMRGGQVELAEVLASTLVALVLPAALTTVAAITWSYQLAGSAAARLCQILDTPVLPQPTEPQSPTGARVEIDQVSFSYGDNLALSEVSLVLEPGTVTALLGPSGSGKSTLATLIARFADPDSGQIRIGGVDLRQLDQDSLYQQVAFVLQDAQLLHMSIRDNIALGRPTATLDEIRQAAKTARIDEFIMNLPAGYDTILGEDSALSGGQEQRIAIARAILLDAPILLLDEATAFADPESEAEIQQALSVLVRGRTVLVIAHRPAAIRGAHQIVVLSNGRIVAQGRHQDLLNEPHYQALLKQSGQLDQVNHQQKEDEDVH